MNTNNQNKTLAKRTLGREYAFKFIYKHLLADFALEKMALVNDTAALDEALTIFDASYNEEDNEHPDNKIDPLTKLFAKELILGSLTQEVINSKKIEKHLTNGNIQKVDRMNLAVLLLGAYEILNDKLTSPGVFINEYVNVAKKYCPNESHGFVNSILDKISKEV